MRRVFLAGVLVVAIPAFASAAPLCITSSLQEYVNLGAGGCSIGGATFSDFSSGPSLFPGATEIAAADIVVTPAALLAGALLDFGLVASAGAGEIIGVLIGYSVSSPVFNVATLAMTGSDATSDGVVTAVQDLCLGGTFLGADPTTCSGTLQSLIVLEDELGPIGPETQPFLLASSFFDVFVDITIDGGTFGSAQLEGTVRNQYTGDQVIPEPTSLLLIGTGLVGLVSRRLRRPRDTTQRI
jgi:PEP-CTERM motif